MAGIGIGLGIAAGGNGNGGGGGGGGGALPTIAFASAVAQAEGTGGATVFTFTLTLARNGQTAAIPFGWTVAGSGANPAAASDFAGGVFPSGTGIFNAGQTSKAIAVSVAPDSSVEPDDGFIVTATASVPISAAVGTGSILNDDATPPAATGAPAVRQVVSAAGDSWTQGNEAERSRSGTGTVVATDRWTNILATSLGTNEYLAPATPSGSISGGIVNAGYGGQTSATIYANIAAVVANDAGRAQDIWTWWGGRNEVTNPGGEAYPGETIARTGQFLALIPHDRKLVLAPYGGAGAAGSIASQANWVRSKRVEWDYRRTKRKHLFELRRWWRALSPFGSDAAAANDALVAGDAVPGNLFTSAAVAQDHPNHMSSPLIAAGLQGPIEAMQNKRVWMLDQTIPDVAYDLAEGAALEVYCKGHVTGCSIVADDPVYPGLFGIAMKPGSTDTALLTRTATGATIPQVLRLSITASGVDTTGAARTHTGAIRILPSAAGAGSTMPVGATLPRDGNATATSRRFPFMAASAAAFANGPRISFVWNGRFDEDGSAMVIASINTLRFNVQRNAGNKLIFTVQDSAGTTLLSLTTATSFTAALASVWLFVSIDVGATPTATIWANYGGADVSLGTPTTLAAGNGLIGLAGAINLFANTYGAQSNFKGRQRVLWMADRYVDFAVAGNRRSFANMDGTPVDYAAGNYAATGGRPQYDLRGAPGDFVTGRNFGSAPDLVFNDSWRSGVEPGSDPGQWT